MLAGCGSDDTSTKQVTPTKPVIVSTKQVIDSFKARTGVTLIRAGSDEHADGLSADEGEDPTGRYGTFAIYVAHDDDDEAHRRVVGDATLEGDIYWHRSTAELPDGMTADWIATKRYHGNVYLVWFGNATKKTDETFTRLDSALQDVAPE